MARLVSFQVSQESHFILHLLNSCHDKTHMEAWKQQCKSGRHVFLLVPASPFFAPLLEQILRIKDQISKEFNRNDDKRTSSLRFFFSFAAKDLPLYPRQRDCKRISWSFENHRILVEAWDIDISYQSDMKETLEYLMRRLRCAPRNTDCKRTAACSSPLWCIF